MLISLDSMDVIVSLDFLDFHGLGTNLLHCQIPKSVGFLTYIYIYHDFQQEKEVILVCMALHLSALWSQGYFPTMVSKDNM